MKEQPKHWKYYLIIVCILSGTIMMSSIFIGGIYEIGMIDHGERINYRFPYFVVVNRYTGSVHTCEAQIERHANSEIITRCYDPDYYFWEYIID